MSRTDRLYGWACALALFCAMLLINPRAEMGISDDWSFTYIAKGLAETGHIRYDGWCEPILGLQLYVGSLFIRLFGFSFTTVRASEMLLSILTVPVLHALLMRCGIRAFNATFGTLMLVLSPLYLPLATTYMSDGFAQNLLVLFFYAAIRSVQSEDERHAARWMLLASVLGFLAGTVRQVEWVAVVLGLPCLGWQQRRRRAVRTTAAVAWLVLLIAIVCVMLWFRAQPYAPGGAVFEPPPGPVFPLVMVFKTLVTCTLLLSPLVCGIALRYTWNERFPDVGLCMALVAIVCAVGLLTYANSPVFWGRFLLGNVTTASVLWRAETLGPRPVIVPGWCQVVAAVFLLWSAWGAVRTLRWSRRFGDRTPMTGTDRASTWLFLPFATTYAALMLTRPMIFDRYLLPLLLVAVLYGARWYERRFAARFSLFALVPLTLLTVFGVGGTHDLFVETRARLAAAEEVRATGVARTEIRAGFEYDAWTQLEMAGYVNTPRMRPASLYHALQPPAGLEHERPSDAYPWRQQPLSDQKCYTVFYRYTPVIRGGYMLERAPGYCFAASKFSAVQYRTWLPPYHSAIYVDQVPAGLR